MRRHMNLIFINFIKCITTRSTQIKYIVIWNSNILKLLNNFTCFFIKIDSLHLIDLTIFDYLNFVQYEIQ